jgi:asparaginyl-tRNA synthetase
MLEPEVAFTDLAGVCTLCEASIQGVTRALLSSCAADIAFLQERYEPGLRAKLELVASAPFARMTYTDALAVLTEAQNLGKVRVCVCVV